MALENEFMDEVSLINMKSEIEILSLMNEFSTQSSLDSIYESEKDDKGPNKIVSFLNKVIKAILDSIASVFDAFARLFSKDNISKEEYLRSRKGEMTFDYDIVKQQKYINSKTKEGNNLLGRLLKGENVHDKVVRYVNDTARALQTKDGRNKVYAAAAPIVYASQVDYQDTVKEFSKLNDQIGYKLKYDAPLNNDDIKSVASTIKSLSGRANNLFGMYFNQYNKLDRMDIKKMKGMKVK